MNVTMKPLFVSYLKTINAEEEEAAGPEKAGGGSGAERMVLNLHSGTTFLG